MNSVSPDFLREIAPTGRLRAAINYGNVVLAHRNEANGELSGVTVDIARELGRRLKLEVDFVPFNNAGRVSDCAGDQVWDIGFLAIDPLRAAGIAFTSAYVIIEGSYLVRQDSPFHTLEQMDSPGTRIAVGNGAAYDLYLTRALKHAQLERAPSSAEAIDLFVQTGLEAAAGVRQPLVIYAASQPGFRVIDGSFTKIEQAMGCPKGRPAAEAYLKDYVEELKASGFIADALARHKQTDATVAPAAAR